MIPRVCEGEPSPRGLSWKLFWLDGYKAVRPRLMASTWAWELEVGSHHVGFSTFRLRRFGQGAIVSGILVTRLYATAVLFG